MADSDALQISASCRKTPLRENGRRRRLAFISSEPQDVIALISDKLSARDLLAGMACPSRPRRSGRGPPASFAAEAKKLGFPSSLRRTRAAAAKA